MLPSAFSLPTLRLGDKQRINPLTMKESRYA